MVRSLWAIQLKLAVCKNREGSDNRGVGKEAKSMTPEEQERIKACTQEIAEIQYRNSDKTSLRTLEGIEQTVRQQMLQGCVAKTV